MVVAPSGRQGRTPPPLIDRRDERGALDRLVDAVRAGREPGAGGARRPGRGQDRAAELPGRRRASGCQVVRVAGVQSEMELAFAGLHLLCAPMLDRLDRLPVPQREALRTAFGLSAGPPPDRFLVGLAVLSLLAEGGRETAAHLRGR